MKSLILCPSKFSKNKSMTYTLAFIFLITLKGNDCVIQSLTFTPK